MPWIVHATKPPNSGRLGWPWAGGYFPRKKHYKKEAIELADLARKHGGIGVRAEKIKGDGSEIDSDKEIEAD